MCERERLRERLAQMVFEDHIRGFATADEAACDILAEIEAAGYVLMERGRVERLLNALNEVVDLWSSEGVSWDESMASLDLIDGDLEPLEGGE